MFNPMASLGLDKVTADPNAIPAGVYDCTVSKVEYVHAKSKNTLGHVITYLVESGDYKGASITHWFTLGNNPTFDANGSPTGYEPTMTEQNKTYYKKAFVDLGIPEDQVGLVDPASVVGRKCTVTLKINEPSPGQVYRNVSGVTLRDGAATAASALDVSEFANASAAAQQGEAATDLSSQL